VKSRSGAMPGCAAVATVTVSAQLGRSLSVQGSSRISPAPGPSRTTSLLRASNTPGRLRKRSVEKATAWSHSTTVAFRAATLPWWADGGDAQAHRAGRRHALLRQVPLHPSPPPAPFAGAAATDSGIGGPRSRSRWPTSRPPAPAWHRSRLGPPAPRPRPRGRRRVRPGTRSQSKQAILERDPHPSIVRDAASRNSRRRPRRFSFNPDACSATTAATS